jgi:PAS domain S-box-containing protein
MNEILSAIVTSPDDAVITKTLDGVITSWSAAVEELFGYSAGEAIGQHIGIIIPPERLAEETYLLERLRKGEAVEQSETKRLGKDGQTVEVFLAVSPVRDANGHITGASETLRDLGARKRAQVEFRTFVESTPIAMLIINNESRITLVNNQTAQLFGYTRSELLDQPVELLVPERFRGSHLVGHRADFVASAVQEMLSPTVQMVEKPRELYGLRKDQSEFPLVVRVNAIRTEERFMVLSLIDLTESNRAEEKLRKFSDALERQVGERTTQLEAANKELEDVRGRLQAVLDSPTAAAIIALDCQGTIKLFNHGAERMLQYQAFDVIDHYKPYLFLTNAECTRRSEELSAATGRRVAEDEIFDASIVPVQSYSRDSVYIRRDGTPVDVNTVVSPMLDSDGQRVGTLGISIDVSHQNSLKSNSTRRTINCSGSARRPKTPII